MNKKLDKALIITQIIILINCLITLIVAIKGTTKENKLEGLIIEELVEIYDSEIYTYTIEELPYKNGYVKYCCIVKFYDGLHYTERVMYVNNTDNVYTEIVIEDKEFE